MPIQLTPGRIAALAIGVPFAVALVGWTSYSFVALAGQGTVHIATPIRVYDGAVTADIGGGNVVIRQVRGKVAELTGTGQYSLIRPVLTETHAGAGTSIGYQCRSYAGNCDLNATLQVPLGTGVTLSTEGGNMSVPVFNGSLQLLSGGGDVNAGNLSGTVLMRTDGGNVGVRAMADPDATIDSGGGDVVLTLVHTPPQHLQVSADGGNIVIVLPPGGTAYDIQANADGGNLSIGRSITQSGDAKDALILDSGGGDIAVSQAG
jgi:hypothetical protein